MTRLRADFKGGTIIDDPLTAAATSFGSSELTDLPTVVAPDTMVVVFDPDAIPPLQPEIAIVTAHGSAANTATILRGQEGTVPRQHDVDTVWIHAPVASDYGTTEDPLLTYYGENALNDEFDDGVLDAAWVRSDSVGEDTHLVWTEAAGVLSAKHTGTDAGNELHGLVKPIGAFAIGKTLQTHVTYFGHNVSSPMAGLCLCDGTARGVGVQVIGAYWNDTANTNAGIRRNLNWTTAGVDAILIIAGMSARAPMHIRLKWVAANSFQFSVSRDGVSWLVQAAQAYTCTPTHMGFFLSSWASASDFTYTFDYFRVV